MTENLNNQENGNINTETPNTKYLTLLNKNLSNSFFKESTIEKNKKRTNRKNTKKNFNNSANNQLSVPTSKRTINELELENENIKKNYNKTVNLQKSTLIQNEIIWNQNLKFNEFEDQIFKSLNSYKPNPLENTKIDKVSNNTPNENTYSNSQNPQKNQKEENSQIEKIMNFGANDLTTNINQKNNLYLGCVSHKNEGNEGILKDYSLKANQQKNHEKHESISPAINYLNNDNNSKILENNKNDVMVINTLNNKCSNDINLDHHSQIKFSALVNNQKDMKNTPRRSKSVIPSIFQQQQIHRDSFNLEIPNKCFSSDKKKCSSSHFSKNICVKIIPNQNDFDRMENSIQENNISQFFKKNYKSMIKQSTYSLLALCSLFGFYFFLVDDERKMSYINMLENIPFYGWVIFGVFIFGVFILCVVIRHKKDKKLYDFIALEDYKKLERILFEKTNQDPNFVGVFQNVFIRENSNLLKISEKKYKNNILPLINKYISVNENVIEAVSNLSDQNQPVWILKKVACSQKNSNENYQGNDDVMAEN